MLEMVQTRAHVSLSRPSTEVLHTSAIRCIQDGEAEQIEDLLRHSLAANTIRAHQSDMQHYLGWGGNIPATPSEVAAYIAAFAGKLAVSTIERRIATLSKAHDTLGVENPCRSPLVQTTLRGLRRKHGTAQKQAKALTREDLFAILDAIGNGMKDVRDRALLLLGFAGGFRRSELVGLDVADIEHVRQGIIITLRHSKTDQEGAGRKIGIPHGRTRHCPVAAVTDWLTRSGITEGAIFRPITRHGQLRPERLSGDAVSEVIRERLAAAGIDPEGYSGHSLRAGFATSAAQAGASTIKIRQQTGHASDAMLSRYIRDGELFVGNAAGAVL
ncbi:MAG: site-specific integrase [Hyphomicrobiaceae bacterium]|nr:site-specific integrase [Hyphomicrobiaceae bacterium]